VYNSSVNSYNDVWGNYLKFDRKGRYDTNHLGQSSDGTSVKTNNILEISHIIIY
jgi:hypothetical protein